MINVFVRQSRLFKRVELSNIQSMSFMLYRQQVDIFALLSFKSFNVPKVQEVPIDLSK